MKEVFIALVTYVNAATGEIESISDAIIVDRETQCEEFFTIIENEYPLPEGQYVVEDCSPSYYFPSQT